jgi:hypothetical protein
MLILPCYDLPDVGTDTKISTNKPRLLKYNDQLDCLFTSGVVSDEYRRAGITNGKVKPPNGPNVSTSITKLMETSLHC